MERYPLTGRITETATLATRTPTTTGSGITPAVSPGRDVLTKGGEFCYCPATSIEKRRRLELIESRYFYLTKSVKAGTQTFLVVFLLVYFF